MADAASVVTSPLTWARPTLAVVIGVVVLLQVVPSVLSFTTGNMDDQRADPLPSQPPGWVFSTVWPVLYLCLAAAGLLVWFRTAAGTAKWMRTAALALFALQLALNWAWIPTYGAKHYQAAMWILVAMLVTGLPAAGLAHGCNPLAGLAWTPYLGWLVFAAMLNSERNTLQDLRGSV